MSDSSVSDYRKQLEGFLESCEYLFAAIASSDKYSLDAIPVEVLVLAFIEFVLVTTFAAVLWYMFGHQ